MCSQKNKQEVVFAKRQISTAHSLVIVIAVLQFGLLIIVLATLERYARR